MDCVNSILIQDFLPHLTWGKMPLILESHIRGWGSRQLLWLWLQPLPGVWPGMQLPPLPLHPATPHTHQPPIPTCPSTFPLYPCSVLADSIHTAVSGALCPTPAQPHSSNVAAPGAGLGWALALCPGLEWGWHRTRVRGTWEGEAQQEATFWIVF